MKSNHLPTLGLAVLAGVVLAIASPASGQILFDAHLTGFAEVPPVDSEHYGSCTGVLSGFDGPSPDPSFHVACDHNVDDASAAHIHIGPVGVAGGVVLGFADPDDIEATWDLTMDQAIRLLAGGYYVNVHTPANPGGEIRGQLRPRAGSADVEVVTFDLDGDQVVPPVATDASGVCVAMVDLEGSLLEAGTMDLYCTHDVENPTEAGIHLGAAGDAGPQLIDLGDPDSPIVVEDIDLDFELAEHLRLGNLYVDIESATHPDGEIRGQLTGCFGSPTTLCLGGRYAVTVDWETDLGGGGSGQGIAVPETVDTGMFWFFEPANLEIMVKVLDACPVNGHTWVFFAGLTNVGFVLEVTDTVTGESVTYENEDETITETVLDTTAFENCPTP